jgi:hypothetical protein
MPMLGLQSYLANVAASSDTQRGRFGAPCGLKSTCICATSYILYQPCLPLLNHYTHFTAPPQRATLTRQQRGVRLRIGKDEK